MGKQSLFKRDGGSSRRAAESGRQALSMLTLDRLRPNPWNTKAPGRYSGPEFSDLVASIKGKGLIQPILARPVEKEGAVDHEIVCGERRFKACLAIAQKNGGPAKYEIITMVRQLSDDEALDLTIIENLQRQDLDPLEEARQFELFLHKHGADSAADLADRIGCSAAYIRRRVAVLDLPGPALKAWRRGQMGYGHLEQLKRLKNKKQILRFVGQIVSQAKDKWVGPFTVKRLQREINQAAPLLKGALFNKTAAGCSGCAGNSSVQKKLFAEDQEKDVKCLDPACYKKNVNNHLLSVWDKKYKPKYKTNGFRFRRDLTYQEYELFSGRVKKACKSCAFYVSLVDGGGAVTAKAVCVGGKTCHQKLYAKKTAANTHAAKSEADEKKERRSKVHGEEFREMLYRDILPARLGSLAPDDEKVLHGLVQAFFIVGPFELRAWIEERLGLDKDQRWDRDQLYKALFGLSKEKCRALLQDLVAEVLLSYQAGAVSRRAMADHVGIDLKTEWTITEAYLKKKYKPELITMGTELGILGSPEVETYLTDTLGKKAGDYEACKKDELINLYLKSGVDLAGKVPAEILE